MFWEDTHSALFRRINRKSLEVRFQTKIQAAVIGTENSLKTDTGKIIHR